MNISIELQIQKRKIEYKNNENNTKSKGEISMDFTGKNIIVTGGASGIGKAIVTGVVEGGVLNSPKIISVNFQYN